MIILGIDPGSRITGYGLVSKQGATIRHIENGAINANSKTATLATRLLKIEQNLAKLIDQFNPDVMAVENIFFAKNAKSSLKLGHARGVCLVSAARNDLDIAEYTPLEVKQATVGYGRATKDQVQKMVKTLLSLPQVAEENASDALAVAICHAHSVDLKTKLSA